MMVCEISGRKRRYLVAQKDATSGDHMEIFVHNGSWNRQFCIVRSDPCLCGSAGGEDPCKFNDSL
jgi:hypothetical protein